MGCNGRTHVSLKKPPSKMLKMGLKIKCRVCKFLFENLSIKKVDDWLNINFLLQHKLSIPTERHIRHIRLVFITFTEFLTSYSKCKKLTFCSTVKSNFVLWAYVPLLFKFLFYNNHIINTLYTFACFGFEVPYISFTTGFKVPRIVVNL